MARAAGIYTQPRIEIGASPNGDFAAAFTFSRASFPELQARNSRSL
jgi:hypothetical protein